MREKYISQIKCIYRPILRISLLFNDNIFKLYLFNLFIYFK